MAHYVAELIQSVEDAKKDERPEKLSRCANFILDLWKHRTMLPNGRRPLEDFEPILRALESLDPDDDTPRYFRPARQKAGKEEQNVDTEQWLDLANGVDYSARILIRHCLVCAAENVVDKSKEWITLAKTLDEEEPDLKVIYTIRDENELVNSLTPDESERRQLEDRIQRLDRFLEIVGALSSDLRERVERLSNTDAKS